MEITKKDSIWLAALLCLTIIMLSKIIFTHQCYYATDLMYQFRPWRVYGSENLILSQLPLWNPYVYCGMPFLGNLQSAIFYPFTIIFYLFSFIGALKSYYVVHLFLAGFFIWLLCQQWGLGRASCFVAAIVFSFNGYFVVRVHYLASFSAYIWLPLLLLQSSVVPEGQAYGAGSHRSLVTDYRLPITGHRLPILVGIIFALQFLAGQPQLLFYAACFLFLWVIFKPDRVSQIVIFGVAGIIAICLVAMQLVPSFELMQLGERTGARGFEWATEWSLHPTKLLCFLSPFMFGRLDTEYFGPGQFWVNCFYIGIIPLILAGIGIYSSIVHPAPLSEAGRGRPSESGHRLSPYGRSAEGRPITDYRLPLVGVLVLALFLALGKYTPIYTVVYKYFPPLRAFRIPSMMMYIVVFCLSIFAGLGWEKFSDKLKQKWQVVVFLLIIGDLFFFNLRVNPLREDKFLLKSSEAGSFLRYQPGYFRIFAAPRLLSRLKGEEEFKECLRANQNIAEHLFDIDGYDPMSTREYNDFLLWIKSKSKEEACRILGIFNVKYMLSVEGVNIGDVELKHRGFPKIYENRHFLPRVFLAFKKKVFETNNELLDYMISNKFNPEDFLTTDFSNSTN